MNKKHARYLVELFAVITLYGIVLAASIGLSKTHPDSPLRAVIAVAPMLPALLLPAVVVRYLRRVDELQRQIQLEALGFAFAGTVVLTTFGYGFLEYAGFPRLSWFAIWPIMGALRIIGSFVSREDTDEEHPACPARRASLDPVRSSRTPGCVPSNDQRHRDGQIRSQSVVGFQDRAAVRPNYRGHFLPVAAVRSLSLIFYAILSYQ